MDWIALVTGLGIGSIATASVQHLLSRRQSAYASHRQELEKRYRVVILLMVTVLDFEANKTLLGIHRPELRCESDVINELKCEWFNMMLFASTVTLSRLSDFVSRPDLENFKKTAISMRKDLGRPRLTDELFAP